MKYFKSLITIAIAYIATSASAADFFDTSDADTPFALGLRVGLNASNQTISSKDMISCLDGWGTGFNTGAVVDINFKNYLTIQPGLFFESRSNNYTYIYNTNNNTEYGHTRHYSFKIPILASVRFNPADELRLHLDWGPYFSYGFGGSDKGTRLNSFAYDDGYFDNRNHFDFGFKMGIGLQFKNHYYIGAHYEAGALDVWKDDLGGRHKAWTFTLGYDF